ncbi:MAG: hypothetical protein J0M20_09235, partial [Burkholderiales bacterium]|nr:hypothetical protein [Burkholderiales bacterium]
MSTAPDTGQSTLFDDLRDAVEARVHAAEPRAVGPLCRVGMVLRALLAAIAVTAIGLAFSHHRLLEWAWAMGTWATWVVPSALLWLLLACAAGQWLAQRWPGWVDPVHQAVDPGVVERLIPCRRAHLIAVGGEEAQRVVVLALRAVGGV